MDMFKTEDLESNSEASSREPEILEGKQEVENVQVHRIPYTDLQNLKGRCVLAKNWQNKLKTHSQFSLLLVLVILILPA